MDKRGKISPLSKQRLVEYSNLLAGYSLYFTWICTGKKINTHTLREIIKFLRKNCSHKQIILHNAIVLDCKPKSITAKYIMWKYKFQFKDTQSEVVENDYVRMCFGNRPNSCTFNSCLGNCVFVDIAGNIGICPFIKNSIELNDKHDIQSIYDVFESQLFAELLVKSIQKRNLCKANCEFFELCKGGCALVSNDLLQDVCQTQKKLHGTYELLNKKTMNDTTFREQTIEQISKIYQV